LSLQQICCKQTGDVNYKPGMEQKIGRILLDFGL